MAKRTEIMALKTSQKGQISIFFSASLVVFVSIIAFVINVGLFVKAKINLQNATDAAAFSGAAVQARQLTKIAYLNWEMRNIYKEWMYKYYVVGSLNTPMVEKNNLPGNSCGSTTPCMDFRLEGDIDKLAVPERKIYDPYNLPAVCIHITGSQTNICKRYAVPGLPEFGGYSIPGTEEASRSFIDILIGEKVNDCVERSKINMLAATTWAYNVISSSGNTLAGRGPAILAERQGAWPRAIELAMRIRNLEKVMNREALQGVDSNNINTYETENFMGNERIVKAFYSGYRNLGNATDSEMKQSFVLTELSPTKVDNPNPSSASNLLIPEDGKYQKQFVDLKLMMVNLATFYAALVPRSEKDKSGACDISKVALPVPGYPLGFYKNPDVLTYYAVKGEAGFTGMFNPFSEDTITLTAYAAAKPMGGRIGPMLFAQKSTTDSALRTRIDAGKLRSVPYITSLNVVGTKNILMPGGVVGPNQYGPGVPLPINLPGAPFWLDGAGAPVGGLPQVPGDVQFGIPNLVYDFANGTFDPETYSDSTTSLFTILPSASDPENNNFQGDKAIGLYNREQFLKFKGDIGGNVTPEDLANHVSRVRAATKYEAANYLIPTAYDFNTTMGVDSFGSMGGKFTSVTVDGAELKRYNVEIYAPLYKSNNQLDVLWGSSDDVVTTIIKFMTFQEQGLLNYIHSLNKAAIQTYQTALGSSASAAAVNALAGFEKAAKGISEIEVTNTDPDYYKNAFPSASCKSLASQFWYFYYGHPDAGVSKSISSDLGCPVTLVELLKEFYAKSPSDPDYSPTHYKMEYNYYAKNWDGAPKKIFSGYMPGPFNGVSNDGVFTPPFPGLQPENMNRNFYSTKLVMLSSLQSGGKYEEVASNFAIYSEGDVTASGATPDRQQGTFANPLEVTDISSIKH